MQHIQWNDLQARASEAFARDGYLVVRGLYSGQPCSDLRTRTLSYLDPLLGPAEFEADLGYPGAPAGHDKPGGGRHGGCCMLIPEVSFSVIGPQEHRWAIICACCLDATMSTCPNVITTAS